MALYPGTLRNAQRDRADLIPAVDPFDGPKVTAARTPDPRQAAVPTPGVQATAQPDRFISPIVQPPQPQPQAQPQSQPQPQVQPAPATVPNAFASGNARTDAYRAGILSSAPAQLQGLVDAPLTDPRVMALSPQEQATLASLRTDMRRGTPGTDVVNFGGRGLSVDEARAVTLLEAYKRNPGANEIPPEQLQAALTSVRGLQDEFGREQARGVGNPLHGYEQGFGSLMDGINIGAPTTGTINNTNVAATTQPTVPAGTISGPVGVINTVRPSSPTPSVASGAVTGGAGGGTFAGGEKITPDNTLRGTRIGFDVNPGNLKDEVLGTFRSLAALEDEKFRDGVEQLGKQTAAMGRTGSGMYDKGFRRLSDRAQTARDAILGNLSFSATSRDVDKRFETDLAKLSHTIGERGYDDRLAREAMGDEADRLRFLSAGFDGSPAGADNALVQSLLFGAGQFGANAGQTNAQLGDTAAAATPYIAQLLRSIFSGGGSGSGQVVGDRVSAGMA